MKRCATLAAVLAVVVGWIVPAANAGGPAAEVRLGARARLNAAGEATVRLRMRCAEPWVVATLSVTLTQGADEGAGHTLDDYWLGCDGRWHRRSVHVVPNPGGFEPGTARATASLQILDPSTGDPVDTAHASRRVRLAGDVAPVLWDQTGSRAGAIASANMVDDAYDSQGADDFTVPVGQVWSIDAVYAPGSFAGTHPEPFVVPAVDVRFYADGGTEPGALLASYQDVAPTTAPDDLTVPLDPPLRLRPGTYWVSVQADLSSLTIFDGWAWAYRNAVTGDPAVWRNPGDGFATGAVDWTGLGSPGSSADFEFDLRGTATAT